MRIFSPSIMIYIGLVAILALLSGLSVFLPYPNLLPSQQLPASRLVIALINVFIMLVLYGGLGYLGLNLSRKIGFPDLWNSSISNKQRLVIPAFVGIGLGLLFILVDAFLSRFHSLGTLPHPQFPLSIVASAIAAIGEEIIFRLFLISSLVWLFSYVILKRKWRNQIFWIAAYISALLFALGHIPSLMILLGLKSIIEIPSPLMSEIILLNGILSISAAYYFKKSGFLAPVGIHFWADIVWHVVWGFTR